MNVRSSQFLRDSVIAVAVLVGLFALTRVQFQPAQIPGYLIIVGFGFVEEFTGPIASNYDLWFGVYLVGLGVVAAALAGGFRTLSRKTDLPQWRLGVAGAAAVVGVLSFLFALQVLFTTAQLTPVLITGGAGILLLAAAAWLSGLFAVEFRPTR